MFNFFDKRFGSLRPKAVLIETGFTGSVLDLADYAERSGAEVHSADLDATGLQHLHDELVNKSLAPFVSLHLQDPTRFLSSKSWIDVAVLRARVGLPATLEQFRLAMSSGAKLIIATNYQTDAAWGLQFAKQQHWTVEHDDFGFSYATRN